MKGQKQVFKDILREEQDTTSRFSGEVPNISLYLIAESLINKTISRILMHVFWLPEVIQGKKQNNSDNSLLEKKLKHPLTAKFWFFSRIIKKKKKKGGRINHLTHKQDRFFLKVSNQSQFILMWYFGAITEVKINDIVVNLFPFTT